MKDGGSGSIVIVSGPVGAGKTTVARELLAAAPGPTVYIEGDTYWSHIAKPSDQQPIEQRFAMIMRAMLSSARHYARDGYEVIVDFSVPPWYLNAVRSLLQEGPFTYAVIRPSEAVCAARAAARSAGAIADYTPYRDLYTAFDQAKQFIIASDESDPRTIAERIRAAIASKTHRPFA